MPLNLLFRTISVLVVVGMPVTRHPPRRSQHAPLTHWVLMLVFDHAVCRRPKKRPSGCEPFAYPNQSGPD